MAYPKVYMPAPRYPFIISSLPTPIVPVSQALTLRESLPVPEVELVGSPAQPEFDCTYFVG